MQSIDFSLTVGIRRSLQTRSIKHHASILWIVWVCNIRVSLFTDEVIPWEVGASFLDIAHIVLHYVFLNTKSVITEVLVPVYLSNIKIKLLQGVTVSKAMKHPPSDLLRLIYPKEVEAVLSWNAIHEWWSSARCSTFSTLCCTASHICNTVLTVKIPNSRLFLSGDCAADVE